LALENLLKVLDGRAKSAVEKKREAARREAERIVQEADTEARRIERVKLRKVKAACASERAGVVYKATLEAKNELIKAEEEVVEKAFKLASDRLARIVETDEYQGILQGLLDECLEVLEGEEIELTVRDEDRVRVEEMMAGRGIDYRFSDAPSDCSGGLAAATTDGRIKIDNTFESRLSRAKETMRREIAQTLFGLSGDT
jgi:V/A-type H+-transporting ATPase subunit E